MSLRWADKWAFMRKHFIPSPFTHLVMGFNASGLQCQEKQGHEHPNDGDDDEEVD